MSPVTRGAMTPASWPATFCAPAHRPAARGPASVPVMANIVGVERPKNMPAPPISQTAARGSTTALIAIVKDAPTALVSAKALRTRVVEAPSTDPTIGDGTGNGRRDGIDAVNRRTNPGHLRDGESAGLHEERWQPGHDEVERVVDGEMPECGAPELAAPKDRRIGHRWCGLLCRILKAKRRVTTNQGQSHRNVITPSPTNMTRQPNCAIARPPKSVPSMGPIP